MNRREDWRQKKKQHLKTAPSVTGSKFSKSDETIERLFEAAMSLQRAGRLAEAERSWKSLRSRVPDHYGININLATVLWNLGRIKEASGVCSHAITLNPEGAEGFALLGAVLGAQGDSLGAIENLERAINLKPQLVTVWVQLALLYREQDNLELALVACRRAESMEPERVDVLNAVGLVCMAREDWEQAEEALRRAAARADIGHLRSQIEINLAALFIARKEFSTAVIFCRSALDGYPAYPKAHNILGVALKFLNDFTGAEKSFRKAIELDKTMTEAQVNLGTVLEMSYQWDSALECYEKALDINPNSAEAWNNRGHILSNKKQHKAALTDFRRAIKIDPDYAEAHLNLAFELLIHGHWIEAWPEFEWRWKTAQMKPFQRSFVAPQWDGNQKPAATLLVHAEQGLGDTLNFIRYIPMASACVGRLILECQPPLLPVLREMDGIHRILARGDPLPSFDFHVPLLSLPGIFETTPKSIPNAVPYIYASDNSNVLLPFSESTLKIGMVWAGDPRNPRNPSRTIGLASLKKFLNVPGCVFYSLQHGEGGDQIINDGLRDNIDDLRPLMKDFGATAALVNQMDLVISVCTSVAHLSGGMGVRTWVLLAHDADWRWLLNRSDSPWYPSVRLFRQKTPDGWSEVVDQVFRSLELFAAREN